MTEQVNHSSQLSWVIDAFKAEDAEGVVELYYEVYGDQYPVKAVYDPQELIRQSAGDAYRVVARTETGEVVGHIALYRSSPPNTQLYEQGQLMVRHDYRTNIAAHLMTYSLEELPARYGLEQTWGEAVCNHLVTQQMTAKAGFYATALEVDLMPAEAYAKAFSRPLDNTGRVATLAVFKTADELAVDQFGKPFLQGNSGIHFNVSHAGAYVVCAVSGQGVGIDIEEIKDADFRKIARLAFSSTDYTAWEA